MRKWLWPDRVSGKIMTLLGVWALFCTLISTMQGQWSRMLEYAALAVFDFGVAIVTGRRSRAERSGPSGM